MKMEPESLTYVDNGDGWSLELRCYRDATTFDARLRPIVMIPGYAMNAFILAFHPTSHSMVSYLCQGGFEVWTANLRGQGGARDKGGGRVFGLQHLSLVDLPVVFSHVQTHTRSETTQLDVIGCSLGASMVYGYLAHQADRRGVVASMVSMGGPFRWEQVHPLMKVAFVSSRLAGSVPIRGTRLLARGVVPLIKRVPALLSIYMNANMIDLSVGDQLVNTIDDPVPHINRQMARWMKQRDLVLEGVNVTEALRGSTLPVFCVIANADGIVPPDTVLSPKWVFASDVVDSLEVGDSKDWFAHADLFISELAEERVFRPLLTWLLQQQAVTPGVRLV